MIAKRLSGEFILHALGKRTLLNREGHVAQHSGSSAVGVSVYQTDCSHSPQDVVKPESAIIRRYHGITSVSKDLLLFGQRLSRCVAGPAQRGSHKPPANQHTHDGASCNCITTCSLCCKAVRRLPAQLQCPIGQRSTARIFVEQGCT